MVHKLSIDDLKSFESIVTIAHCFKNKDKRLITKAFLSEEGVLRAKYIVSYKQDGDIKTITTSYLEKAVDYYNQIE